MDELKDKGKRVMENIGEKRVDMIQKWEEKSRDFIDAFLLLFGREGPLVSHYTLLLSTGHCDCFSTKTEQVHKLCSETWSYFL
jgi:hypothetical protein